jgi:cytochrome c oxidase subunit 3
MTEILPTLRQPFTASWQQRRADVMGMYLFLATEIMLFGGLVVVLMFYRFAHPAEIIAASSRLNPILGTVNTAVLLTSSLFVALAAEAGRRRARGACILNFLAAMGLGVAFLVVKAIEYADEYVHGLIPGLGIVGAADAGILKVFMSVYFVATGLHAVHLGVGIALVGWTISRLWRNAHIEKGDSIPVELVGLYWHFVDVVWIFLFPALYLVRT